MDGQHIKNQPCTTKSETISNNTHSGINKNSKLLLKIFKKNNFSSNLVTKETNQLKSNLRSILKKININVNTKNKLNLTNSEKKHIFLDNTYKSSNNFKNLKGSASDTQIILNNYSYFSKYKKDLPINIKKKRKNFFNRNLNNFKSSGSRLINKMKIIFNNNINPVNMTFSCEKNSNLNSNKQKLNLNNNYSLFMIKTMLISEIHKHYTKNKFKDVNEYFSDWLNYKNNNQINNKENYLTIDNLYNYINDEINFTINKEEIFQIFKIKSLNEGLSFKDFDNFFFEEKIFKPPKIGNEFIAPSSIRKKEEYYKYELMFELLKEKKYLMYEKVFFNSKFLNSSAIDFDNIPNIEYNFNEFYKLLTDLYPGEKIICSRIIDKLFDKYINIKTKKINMKKFIRVLFDSKSKLFSEKNLNSPNIYNNPKYNFNNFMKNWKRNEKLNRLKYNISIYNKDSSINKSHSIEKPKNFLDKSTIYRNNINKDNIFKINSTGNKIDIYKNKSFNSLSPKSLFNINYTCSVKDKSMKILENINKIISSNITGYKEDKKIYNNNNNNNNISNNNNNNNNSNNKNNNNKNNNSNNNNIKLEKKEKDEINKELQEKKEIKNSSQLKKKIEGCDITKKIKLINKKNSDAVDNKIYEPHIIDENARIKNKNSDILDLL